MTNEQLESIARNLLSAVRQEIQPLRLRQNLLPKWVRVADIRAANINGTVLIAFFDSAGREDSYKGNCNQRSDLALLLDIQDYEPTRALIYNRKHVEDGALMVASAQPDQPSVLTSTSARDALFADGQVREVLGPKIVFNVILSFPTGKSRTPRSVRRLVPCALYIHETKLRNGRTFPDAALDIARLLQRHHDDRMLLSVYHQGTEFGGSLPEMKERMVVVLGRYGDCETELRALCQALSCRGYKARLIKDIPDVPEMSNEEKVRFFVSAARFCVILDREPSGHIAEYVIAREARAIIGMCRPYRRGSTFMIGDDHLVDINHISLFQFLESPVEVLDSLVEWAEEMVLKRKEAYNRHYPWREDISKGGSP